MKKSLKRHLAIVALILLAAAFGIYWAQRFGLLWKTTIELTDYAKSIKECPLHHQKLKVEKVEVDHGIHTVRFVPGFIEPFWKAQRSQFPWANTGAGRDIYGCDDPSVSWELRKYCEQCRVDERHWIEEWNMDHPRKNKAEQGVDGKPPEAPQSPR